MKNSITGYLLPALMIFGTTAGAATREELLRLDATQLPGTVSVCEGEGTMLSGNTRVKLTDRTRGTVISGRGEPLRYRIERSNSMDGVVYARYEFEMITRLEEDTQFIAVDTHTVHVSFPKNPTEAAKVADYIGAHQTARQPFQDIHFTHFPAYEINAAPDDALSMHYRCGPEPRTQQKE